MPIEDDVAAVREDVAYMRAKIEALPDHETRIRRIERWMYGIPASLLVAVGGIVAAFIR